MRSRSHACVGQAYAASAPRSQRLFRPQVNVPGRHTLRAVPHHVVAAALVDPAGELQAGPHLCGPWEEVGYIPQGGVLVVENGRVQDLAMLGGTTYVLAELELTVGPLVIWGSIRNVQIPDEL